VTPRCPQPRRCQLPDDELRTRGLTTPFLSSILALVARLVFAALSKVFFSFFVPVFRLLPQTRNTHGAMNPVLQRPLSAPMCLSVLVGAEGPYFTSLWAHPNPDVIGSEVRVRG
jgi:hypothetical protein